MYVNRIGLKTQLAPGDNQSLNLIEQNKRRTGLCVLRDRSLKLAPKSKVHIRGLIQSLWDYAMWRGDVPTQRNPMELVTVKNASKRTRKPRTMTIEEFHRLSAVLTEPYRTMATVSVCLGLRWSEMGTTKRAYQLSAGDCDKVPKVENGEGLTAHWDNHRRKYTKNGIEGKQTKCDSEYTGKANMRHNNSEMLVALRQSLDDLERVKLISPDDLEIVALKTTLRQRITSIEDADAKGH